MDDGMKFFSKKQNNITLRQLSEKMGSVEADGDFESERNEHIRVVIGSMIGQPDEWDKYCEININWIGDAFIHTISDQPVGLTKAYLDDLFSICFRFLLELYLSMNAKLSIDMERVKSFAFNNLESFEEKPRHQIDYAVKEMPIAIFKTILNSEDVQSIKRFNEISQSADSKREEWDLDIAAKEKRVEVLKEALEKYETAFNFVGLYQGFDDLAKAKEGEREGLLKWLVFFGILVVTPFLLELFTLYTHLESVDKIKNILLLSMIPTISITAILIYYFRVLLYNYKSVKSQLLQIDLRKTLCRFIQHYSEYSAKMKKQDNESLAKFENIIFAGILSDEDNLPSTYDGISQLGNLVKSLKP